MKENFLSALPRLGSAVLLISLLGGCGEGANERAVSNSQPFEKKITRELKDWTWEVDTKVNNNSKVASFVTHYYDNIPSKIVNFQFFIDSIPNQGFNGPNGWEVYGADYLIENDTLYKSLSDTKWKWKKIGKISYLDNKKAGDERVITLQVPSSQIQFSSNKINVYIEPYDKNWNGEYFTIPLPDIKVKASIVPVLSQDMGDKERIAKIRKAVRRGALHMPVDIVLSPDKKRAIISVNMRGVVALKIYDVTDPTSPVFKTVVSHNKIKSPNISIENLKVMDSKRVSYKVYERGHDQSESIYISAKRTGVIYDVITDYVSGKMISYKYSADSKGDPRIIIENRLKARYGNALTYYRFDYSSDYHYAIVSISLSNSIVRIFDVYDVANGNNPRKMHELLRINSSISNATPRIVGHRGILYNFENDTTISYRIVDKDNKTYNITRDILTKKILSKELFSKERYK